MSIDERWTRDADLDFELLDPNRHKHPDDDLRVQSCFLYEYARSSVKCVEDVQLLREAGIILPTTIPGHVGDSREKAVSLVEYAQNHSLPVGDFDRIKLLTFVGRFEGFPDLQWDAQPKQVEDSLVDLGSERLPWIGRGKDTEWTAHPSAILPPQARLEERFDLWIDWRLSNNRLFEVLQEQLKHARPPEFPEPEKEKSNYCIYAGMNFPFGFLTALDWLSTRRKAASIDHVPRSGDFWETYVSRFQKNAKDPRTNARTANQKSDNAAAVLKWFSLSGHLRDPGHKGRIRHVEVGKTL